MNTFHDKPRSDCKNFAPCGKQSLSKCRIFKGRLPDCAGCTLVRRKSKTLHKTDPGRKVCPKCGKELNKTMFGIRKFRIGEKQYSCLASKCRFCATEDTKQRYKKKKLATTNSPL